MVADLRAKLPEKLSDELDDELARHQLNHGEKISRAEAARRGIRLWLEIDNPDEVLDA